MGGSTAPPPSFSSSGFGGTEIPCNMLPLHWLKKRRLEWEQQDQVLSGWRVYRAPTFVRWSNMVTVRETIVQDGGTLSASFLLLEELAKLVPSRRHKEGKTGELITSSFSFLPGINGNPDADILSPSQSPQKIEWLCQFPLLS